jgi:integrase
MGVRRRREQHLVLWRVSREQRRLRRSLGLDKVRLHDLRHGFATLHLTLGTHVRVVQEALGHSDVATTLRIYSHVIPGMQREAAETN